LLAYASYVCSGDPQTVVDLLISYVENTERLGQRIYAHELWSYLNKHGIQPNQLRRNRGIAPRIKELQIGFEDSLEKGLINEHLIPRDETDKCLKSLERGKQIIIHGSAGSGKSGILYELVNKLKESDILWLGVRLDRQIPQTNASQFGKDLGLPDSPINCLAALSGEKLCVIVLDQLDALRWTSVHSLSSLEVCKELIRQVNVLNNEGRNIGVVLSCRTFDLQHDPEIKSLLEKPLVREWNKINVSPLSSDLVKKEIGKKFHSLSVRQKEVLSNMQNLKLWTELATSDNYPVFQSASDLLTTSWQRRHEEIERQGIPSEQINEIINKLVEWLQQNNLVTAPEIIVADYSLLAIKALKSYGILEQQQKRIGFTHQSYLDFFIAERVVRQILDGDSVLDWLASYDEQTIFKREQLRQALALLMDSDIDVFLRTIQQIIQSPNVRFHLKHLVLEVLGQMEAIKKRITDYLLELLDDPGWFPHVLETVLNENSTYIQFLIEEGLTDRWLFSENEQLVNGALKLLGSVSEQIPDLVSGVLQPFIHTHSMCQRIMDILPRDPSFDSESIFELRLALIRQGATMYYVDLELLNKDNPFRIIRLIEALLSAKNCGEMLNSLNCEYTCWQENEYITLIKAAEKHPQEAWNQLVPHIERLSAITVPWYDERLAQWQKDLLGGPLGTIPIGYGIVCMVAKAGRTIANCSQMQFEDVSCYEDSDLLVIQRIIAEVYADLPRRLADHGIKWLLAKESRFRLGYAHEAKWGPAACIVKALSPYCSQELFQLLEDEIVYYHDPNELVYAKSVLGHGMNYCDGLMWGVAQHILLPALCPEKIKKNTADLITVLQRRFASRSSLSFAEFGQANGGFIGSALNPNLDIISDRSWLSIIGNKKIPQSDSGHWKKGKDGNLMSSSIQQFSRSLGMIAGRYPERFGQLALAFPKSVAPDYVAEIIMALAMQKPGKKVPENEQETWEQASWKTVLDVWRKYHTMNDREVVLSFCRLLSARCHEKWPLEVVEWVNSFATSHTHPATNELIIIDNVRDINSASIDSLWGTSYNCVRGVAAIAISDLLREHSELFGKLKPGIEKLVNDPHPAVRMATILICKTLLGIDRDQAVSLFVAACHGDERIAASPFGLDFLKYTIHEYQEELVAIILDIVSSSQGDVALCGAELVFGFNLLYGLFDSEVQLCIKGTPEQRLGLTKAVVSLIWEETYADRCREVLSIMMNDSDKKIREEIGKIFRDGFLDRPLNVKWTTKYASSLAYFDNFSIILDALEVYEHTLLPFAEVIFSVCESCIDGRDSLRGIPYQLPSLLLRLYEQAQDSKESGIMSKCLDIWDHFFENRFGNTRKLMAEIGIGGQL